MKKILIFVFFIFFLTGCSAKIDVDISNNSINQNFLITLSSNESKNKTAFLTLYNSFLQVEHSSELLANYNIKDKVSLDKTEASIKYDLLNYDSDYALISCFDNSTIEFDNSILSIDAKNFNCFKKYSSLDSLTIEITTEYQVQTHNADQVNGNTYIYNITKQNNKNINFSLKYENYESKGNSVITNNNQSMMLIISLIAIIIFSLLLLFIYQKSKKNNKI